MNIFLKFFLVMWLPITVMAQSPTEIYVFDVKKEGDSTYLANPTNITYQNPGYDNQPSFAGDSSLFYVSTRDGQTDVMYMEINGDSGKWITSTPGGSEYSPTLVPGGNLFSYIRLDTSGLQRLYVQSREKDSVAVLFDDTEIGYYCWINENSIAAFVLGDPVSLQICYLNEGKCYERGENIGRSIHVIPNTSLISYVDKQSMPWKIMSHEPRMEVTRKIITTLDGSEDMCWASDGTIYMGSGSELYKFHAAFNRYWVKVADLAQFGLSDITRLAINPDGSRIAVVVKEKNHHKIVEMDEGKKEDTEDEKDDYDK